MIEVAAGVLSDAQGRALLMRRLPGTHLAGLWEFPGGKLEPGEGIAGALARELREELGIEARGFEPLISLPWSYPGKTIRLHALRVTEWHGEPCAHEGHPLQWVHPDRMIPERMPPADRPIVAALRLPALYAITPPDYSDRDAVRAWLHVHSRAAGRSLLQLRLPETDRADLRGILHDVLSDVPGLRPCLLVNADVELARGCGIGVHLRAQQLAELRQRPLPGTHRVGVSCHGARELKRAAELGADFATLSPVRATSSHPGAAPLGWDRFAELVRDARLPVYALGGVGPKDLDRARAAGAQGVAGISAFASPS